MTGNSVFTANYIGSIQRPQKADMVLSARECKKVVPVMSRPLTVMTLAWKVLHNSINYIIYLMLSYHFYIQNTETLKFVKNHGIKLQDS